MGWKDAPIAESGPAWASAPIEGGKISAPVETYNPTEGNSFGKNALIGAGKAFTDLGRGAGQIARTVLPTTVADKLNLPTEQSVAESRRLDAPLMNTTGGKVGYVGGNVAAAIPAAFIPGANTYVGSTLTGAALGSLQPTVQGESRLGNAGKGAAMGIISKFVTDKAANAVASRLAAQQEQSAAINAENSVRNSAVSDAQNLGYTIPPTQANPSGTNQVLEGISGKIKTGQVASLKNQEVTNNLVRKSLGLPDDAPLTKATMAEVRDNAGKAYEAISQIPSIKTDAAYQNAVQGLKGAYSSVEKEAPEIASKYTKEFDNLIAGMNKPEFSGEGANEIIKLLRYEANNVSPTANAAEKAIGKAQLKAANALEDLIDRNVASTGNAAAVQDLRNARQLIAKSYDVEKALTERGNVDARTIAKLMKKGRLSGELESVGKFGAAFPKAAQEIDSSIPATSPLDWATGITTAAATGNVSPLALVGARPGLRALILSKPYQNLMTQAPMAAPSLSTRIGANLLGNDVVRAAIPPASTLGVFAYGSQQ